MKSISKTGGKIVTPIQIILFTFVAWFAYFSASLGRQAFSAGISNMVKNYGYSKSELGTIVALYFLTFALGQLLCGYMTNKISPVKLVFLSLSISPVMNVLLTIFDSFAPMAVIWMINGLVQAFVWTPLIIFCTKHLDGNQSAKTIVNLCTSGPAAVLFSYLLSFVSGKFFSWKFSMYVSAVTMIAAAVIWNRFTKEFDTSDPSFEMSSAPLKADENKKNVKKIAVSALIFMLIPALISAFISGILKDGITTWIPTYLQENFSIDAPTSALISVFLPIFNFAGTYISFFAIKKLNSKTKTLKLFNIIMLVNFVILLLPIPKNILLVLAVFAINAATIVGVNTIITAIIPLKYEKTNRMSLCIGILNFSAYIGTSAASAMFGFLSDGFGWGAVQLVWIALAFVGFVVGFLKPKKVNLKS